jgi:hypothetical protein
MRIAIGFCGPDAAPGIRAFAAPAVSYVSPSVIFVILLALGVASCASNPEGSNWALADFNKYDRNYAPFPTDRLKIGMSKAEAQAMFGANMKRVSADQETETFVVDRWVAVAGPDYVGEQLFMRFDRDRLANWKVDKGNVITVTPRAW